MAYQDGPQLELWNRQMERDAELLVAARNRGKLQGVSLQRLCPCLGAFYLLTI